MVAVPVTDDDVPDPFFLALMTGAECLEVADVLHPPSFYADALCREHPEVEFYPDKGHPTEPAKEVCRRCLVRGECLTFALEHRERGIWGATSEKQRKQILKGRLSIADVFAALDARTRRVTESVTDVTAPALSATADIPEPCDEKARCPSCEEMFPVVELDAGGWCRECWPVPLR